MYLGKRSAVLGLSRFGHTTGEGYERLLRGEKEENDGEFHALAADYEMSSYFRPMVPLAFAGGLGGHTAHQDDEPPARRLLARRASKVHFPVHAGAHHGVARYAKACFSHSPFSSINMLWCPLIIAADAQKAPLR